MTERELELQALLDIRAIELKVLTAERDRLAEALRNCLPFISGEGCGEYQDAKEALQSLKQPKKYDANEHQSFYP